MLEQDVAAFAKAVLCGANPEDCKPILEGYDFKSKQGAYTCAECRARISMPMRETG